MPQDLFHYDKMVERALRGVIRDALARVAQEGLKSAHHFFIGFATTEPGVVIPPRLLERYPEEMTIVLQYQFWALEVSAERFSVTLSFNDVPERLVVPFAAVTAFADPAAKFGLQFQQETGAAPDDEPAEAAAHGAPTGAGGAPPSVVAVDPLGDTKVVTLDNFRRK
jgi:hypothetical protein